MKRTSPGLFSEALEALWFVCVVQRLLDDSKQAGAHGIRGSDTRDTLDPAIGAIAEPVFCV
jgi:hypothetical protein